MGSELSASVEHWEDLKTLFGHALDLAQEQREALLGSVEDEDPLLRRELEALIAAHEDAGSHFLEEPSEEVAARFLEALTEAETRSAPEAGTRVGPYRVLRELGRGGMGRVYLAQRDDGQFAKRVALKCIHRGMDSDELLTRFHNERQILAALEHPHIARLLDGGATEDGRPYLVMEHVEGMPIDRYADERGLSVQGRLELFLTVGAAVQAAHQSLVIHRDLKPANILVTEDGAPKLLDFGVAKILDPRLAHRTLVPTVQGAVPLTPDFASPEQIWGEPVTTASDVYSLGVLLYLLLTGRKPLHFPDGTLPQVARALREQEPLPPSAAVLRGHEPVPGGDARKVRRRLRGDLDSIVLKALEKDPRRRYGTVEGLLADLRRHLAGLPVTARAATPLVRLGKLVRRHKVAAAVAALILAFAAVMTWLAGELARERSRAEQERDRLRQVNEFVTGIFEGLDPGTARAPEVSVRELLDGAVRRLERDLAQAGESRRLFRATLGRLLTAVGAYDEAEALLEEAADDDAGNGSNLFTLADLRIHQTRFQEAEALLRELLTRIDRGGERDGGTLPDRATLHHLLASVFFEQDRFAEAETEARRALLLVDSGSPPELPGEIRSTLAEALIFQGGWNEGFALQRQAVEVLTRSVGADYLSTLQARRSLAGFLYAAEHYEEARRELEDLAGLYEKVLGPKHTYLAGALNTLGDTYRALGRLELAERYHRRGLAIRREVLGGDHADLALSLNSLAGVLTERGALEEAIPLYREALEIYRRGHSLSLRVATQSRYLSRVLVRRGGAGDLEEAGALLSEAYERLLRDPAFGAENPYTAETRRELEAFREAHGALEEPRARSSPSPSSRGGHGTDPRAAAAADAAQPVTGRKQS